MLILLVVFCIVVVVVLGSISSRVSVLENEISKILLQNANPSKSVLVAASQKATEVTEDTKQEVATYEDSESSEREEVYSDEPNFLDRIVGWFMQDVLIKLGGLIVLLGVGFFLSIAFKYIGDGAKIAIGYAFAVAIGSFGFWWMKKSEEGGSVLLTVAAGVGLFTTYSGMYIYSLFSPLIGTLSSVVIALVIGSIAAAKNIKSLGVAAFILAVVSPLLFGYYREDVLGVFIYIFCLSFAANLIDYVKDWRELPIVSFLAAGFYSVIALGGGLDFMMMVIAFLQTLSLTSYSVFKVIKNRLIDSFDAGVLLVGVLYVLFWTFNVASGDSQAFIMILWSLVYAVIAFLTYIFTKNQNSTYVYAATSVLFAFIATAKIFDGASLVIAFILEGLAVTLLTHYITKDFQKSLLSSLTTAVGLIYTLTHFVNSMSSTDIFVVVLQSLSSLAIGTTLYLSYKNKVDASAALAYPTISAILLSALAGSQIDDFNAMMLVLIGLTFVFSMYSEYVMQAGFLKFVSLVGYVMVYISLFINLFSSLYGNHDYIDYNLYGVVIIFIMLAVANLFIVSKSASKVLMPAIAAISILAASLIWVVLHVHLAAGLATFVSLIIYSVAGYILLIFGNLRPSYNLKVAGQTVLSLVAARVILLDAWGYSKPTAVAICIVVGLILMATMFVTNKKEE